MKKIFILAIGLMAFTCCHESLEDRAAREAKSYTEKNCPTPVVNNTRMDSITFDKQTHTIAYYYTLCNESDNAEVIKKESGKLKQILLDGLKGSTQLKKYKEAGFPIRYIYHSEKNPKEIIYEVTFKEEDYSQKQYKK